MTTLIFEKGERGERGDGWRDICSAEQSIQRKGDSLKEKQGRFQAKFVAIQMLQSCFSHFRREVKVRDEVKFLTWDIAGSLSAGLQFIQSKGVSSRISKKSNSIVTLLRKSYKPLIMRECSYRIHPI